MILQTVVMKVGVESWSEAWRLVDLKLLVKIIVSQKDG